MEWKNIKDSLPKENQTVWLCNPEKGYVWLGCLADTGDGWIWAESNGLIYSEGLNIVSECESEDEYDVTHWMELPTLPKK